MPVIHRNSTIPTSRVERVVTVAPNQTMLQVKIYQGEGRRVEDNLFLGEFEVKGIPPGPAGQPVDVRFTYDLNGVLEVEATIVETKKLVSHVVARHARGLSAKQIAEAVKQMEKLKTHPGRNPSIGCCCAGPSVSIRSCRSMAESSWGSCWTASRRRCRCKMRKPSAATVTLCKSLSNESTPAGPTMARGTTMTTGISPDVPPACRWAAEMLGVPEDAAGAEARGAYFRKLRENDFASPGSLHHALRLLEGQKEPAELNEEWLLEEEGRLHAEIESFAEEFFNLTAKQRRERWEALLCRCESAPALAARLQNLKIAGLLDGKRATTHWRHADRLAAQYPLIRVDPDVLYVDEGTVMTSAGSAAGIDLCLHIVRKDFGAAICNQVARRLVVSPHRDGDQSQYVAAAPMRRMNSEDRFSKLLDWAVSHMDRELTVGALARQAKMSARNFARR